MSVGTQGVVRGHLGSPVDMSRDASSSSLCMSVLFFAVEVAALCVLLLIFHSLFFFSHLTPHTSYPSSRNFLIKIS